jgi:uncharacterized protein (TIGR02145 family)
MHAFPQSLAFAILTITFLACSNNDAGNKPNYGAPLEYGGQTYKTAKIGTQTWIAENLNYETKHRGYHYIEESSMCYQDNPDNCAKYGRLYDWETAMSVCPKGWHLPSNAEWDKLFRFIDGDPGTKSPYKSPTAGKHLKAVSGWNHYKLLGLFKFNGNGTDDYGFSALPGSENNSGNFLRVGNFGKWWSASEYGTTMAYSYCIFYHEKGASWGHGYKDGLHSVRCVKD